MDVVAGREGLTTMFAVAGCAEPGGVRGSKVCGLLVLWICRGEGEG